jgi:hypothetical protein
MDPEVHYCILKSLYSVPTQNQKTPIHNLYINPFQEQSFK